MHEDEKGQKYHRYQIHTLKAPNITPHPHRFNVKVNRLELAKLLIKEVFHYKTHVDVILSRPCVYGVFSGPLGGFAPRERLCVGCLRCTTQYPEMVEILHNPACHQLGDAYFTADRVDTVVHEAETGRIPIKGAGYRGKFGGEGWDGMWTDMSEIVRPTRDGIHGREFISTEIDLGAKPSYLKFDSQHQLADAGPQTVSIPIPLLFDILPACTQLHPELVRALIEAALDLQTLVVIPFEAMSQLSLRNPSIIPLITPKNFEEFKNFGFAPKLIEMSGWNENFYRSLRSCFPHAIPILRLDFDDENLLPSYQSGVRTFHLTANYHGRSQKGRFVLDLIRDVQKSFVQKKCREEVTMIGSGGIITAEHLPKAIICGLDAVALDTSVMAALQSKFIGNCVDRESSCFHLPDEMTAAWGKQRLINLAGAWTDQLLEILGAMGLREVRRLRGEMGRAMFQNELEREAFAGIADYDSP